MSAFRPDGHLSEEALLLAQGGERMPASAASHLVSCSVCAERAERIALQVAALAPSPTAPAHAADHVAARTRLQKGIAAVTQESKVRVAVLWMLQPKVLLRASIVVALIAISIALGQAGSPRAALQALLGRYEETGPVPNPSLTPGHVATVDAAALCSRDSGDLDPVVSAEKQAAVFAEYRMNRREAKRYQVDYLINPQLGGTDDLQNLWPEPLQATVWNATAKDALERRLWAMVCGQQIDLTTAQQDLAENWIVAYKKYFHAERPIGGVVAAAGMKREGLTASSSRR